MVYTISPDKRINHILRRLVATGNMVALVASDPGRFSESDRRQAVRAWDASVDALRTRGARKEKSCTPTP